MELDIESPCHLFCQVSLPKLITLACQPSNTLAFVQLSKIATNMALKARSLGQVPYLSSFHLSRKYAGGGDRGEGAVVKQAATGRRGGWERDWDSGGVVGVGRGCRSAGRARRAQL